MKANQRAFFIVLSVLLVATCASIIASIVLALHARDVEIVQLSTIADNAFVACDNGLVSQMRAMDGVAILRSSDAIIRFKEQQQQSEETRLLEAQTRAEQQREFYEKLAELRAQQQELQEQLDEQALEDIEAMGGIDATVDNITVEDDELASRPVRPSVAPVSESELPEETLDISDAVDGQDDAEDKIAEEAAPVYYGQFRANIVCTCAACFDPEKWNVATSGDKFILADPAFIEPGTKVMLDQGITAIFEVRDAKGLVSGRSVIVFDNNHSEVGGGMQLYPKITQYIG